MPINLGSKNRIKLKIFSYLKTNDHGPRDGKRRSTVNSGTSPNTAAHSSGEHLAFISLCLPPKQGPSLIIHLWGLTFGIKPNVFL